MTDARNRLPYTLGIHEADTREDAWIDEGKSKIIGPGSKPGKIRVGVYVVCEVDAADILKRGKK